MEFFAFCNGERPHHSRGYLTPDAVDQSGVGGGAKIVARFGEAERKLGPRQTAAIEGESTTPGRNERLRLRLRFGLRIEAVRLHGKTSDSNKKSVLGLAGNGRKPYFS
jgi:putative transposase